VNELSLKVRFIDDHEYSSKSYYSCERTEPEGALYKKITNTVIVHTIYVNERSMKVCCIRRLPIES